MISSLCVMMSLGEVSESDRHFSFLETPYIASIVWEGHFSTTKIPNTRNYYRGETNSGCRELNGRKQGWLMKEKWHCFINNHSQTLLLKDVSQCVKDFVNGSSLMVSNSVSVSTSLLKGPPWFWQFIAFWNWPLCFQNVFLLKHLCNWDEIDISSVCL